MTKGMYVQMVDDLMEKTNDIPLLDLLYKILARGT